MSHKRNKFFLIIGLLLVPFSLASCSLGGDGPGIGPENDEVQAPKGNRAVGDGQVEVDMYSGLPNPNYLFAAGGVDSLLQKIDDLPKLESGHSFADNLGYRGMVVTFVGDNGETVTVKIQGGVVGYNDEIFYEDTNRGVEKWLLEQVKASLSDDEYQIVLAAVDGSQ